MTDMINDKNVKINSCILNCRIRLFTVLGENTDHFQGIERKERGYEKLLCCI